MLIAELVGVTIAALLIGHAVWSICKVIDADQKTIGAMLEALHQLEERVKRLELGERHERRVRE